MATIISGKEVSKEVKAQVLARASFLSEKFRAPCLAVIRVGDDPASEVYVRNKMKATAETGIKGLDYHFDDCVSEEELLELISKLNADDAVDGILVQLPLPKKFSEEKILKAIDPEKDVDGFSETQTGKLFLGKPEFAACTPSGVIKLLEYYHIDPKGKAAAVVGRSNIVGKPMAHLLLQKDATVTICHSKTPDIAEILKKSDIVVVAIGKPKFVTGDMLKEGAVVVDVGINRVDGRLVGDVDFESAEKVASFITPVPGGVGPMTVAMLMVNTVKSAEKRLMGKWNENISL